MHRAVTSSTAMRSTYAPRLLSSSTLKRPVNARSRKITAFSQTAANQNSTLALEKLAQLRRSNANRLSWSQIRAVMASAAVPMVGFGFMDNFVMIQAGSYIDSTLGVQFGLATMTAAAMGQIVSDVSGVLFGGTVERFLSPWVTPANLTATQQKLAIVPRLRLAGAAFGVIIGCCLGACSLLFVDDHSESKGEQMDQLRDVFRGMAQSDSLDVQSSRVHLTGRSYSLSENTEFTSELANEHSSASLCAKQQEIIIEGCVLFVPIKSTKDDTVAVLELGREDVFSSEDIESVRHLARHLGIFMDRLLSD